MRKRAQRRGYRTILSIIERGAKVTTHNWFWINTPWYKVWLNAPRPPRLCLVTRVATAPNTSGGKSAMHAVQNSTEVYRIFHLFWKVNRNEIEKVIAFAFQSNVHSSESLFFGFDGYLSIPSLCPIGYLPMRCISWQNPNAEKIL